MKHLFAIAALLIFGHLPLAANAAPVSVDTFYSFGFGGVGSSLDGDIGHVNCTNTGGADCVDAPGTTWDFTLASAGTLTVLDLFLVGDQFEIFDGAASLGLTSAPGGGGGGCGDDWTCALADGNYSRGVFALSAGSYSISGTVALSPFGGGAGGFVVQTSPIPLPGALPLLTGALLGFGVLRRRRKS